MSLAHKVYTTIAVLIATIVASFVISAGVNGYNPSVNGYTHDANITIPMLSEDRYMIDHTPFSLPHTSGQCGEDSGIACK